MENLTGGTPPVRYLPCVVPCKLYFCKEETKIAPTQPGRGGTAYADLLFLICAKDNRDAKANQYNSQELFAIMFQISIMNKYKSLFCALFQ